MVLRDGQTSRRRRSADERQECGVWLLQVQWLGIQAIGRLTGGPVEFDAIVLGIVQVEAQADPMVERKGDVQAPLCWLLASSARSEAPRPPQRDGLITARRGPVSRGFVPGSVHSF